MRRARVFHPCNLPGAATFAMIAWLAAAAPVLAATDEYLPVGDPIEAELRVLDVLGPASTPAKLRLPHLGSRPLQLFELDSLPAADPADFARRISLARIQRVLAREADSGATVAGRSPRLFQRRYPEAVAVEASVGAEGSGEFSNSRAHYASGTGIHMRLALAADRWLVYSHLVAGYQDSARSFADPFILNTDLTTITAESYLSYTASGGRWNAQFGRSRWHWGPGDEGSLLLSKTSAPITGLAFHVRIEPLRADLTALSATLRNGAGEQLAAHRIEWQPADRLRVGIAEAARYQSSAWQPLYLVSVIPFQLVQRLEAQDEPGAAGAIRNNVLVAGDVGWRVAPGTRVYGEALIDDLHLIRRVTNPNKYGYQLGWEGVGPVFGTRVTWGGEFTRITQFVYTSYFGRDFTAQGRPLGFPVAPDARRLRLRLGWDPAVVWQLSAVAAETWKGENTLADPFVPGPGASVDAAKFLGVVEVTREIEAGLRWWPAGGADFEIRAGYRRVENADHIAGVNDNGAYGRFALRLVR